MGFFNKKTTNENISNLKPILSLIEEDNTLCDFSDENFAKPNIMKKIVYEQYFSIDKRIENFYKCDKYIRAHKAYTNSKRWKELKEQRIKKDNYKCVVCENGPEEELIRLGFKKILNNGKCEGYTNGIKTLPKDYTLTQFRRFSFVLHHLTYKRVFHEDIDDFITVCSKCHSRIHHNSEHPLLPNDIPKWMSDVRNNFSDIQTIRYIVPFGFNREIEPNELNHLTLAFNNLFTNI